MSAATVNDPSRAVNSTPKWPGTTLHVAFDHPAGRPALKCPTCGSVSNSLLMTSTRTGDSWVCVYPHGIKNNPEPSDFPSAGIVVRCASGHCYGVKVEFIDGAALLTSHPIPTLDDLQLDSFASAVTSPKIKMVGESTPVHTCTTTNPDGTTEAFICRPTGHAKVRRRCKYCYQTHMDWWRMDPKDYGGKAILLCGKCEHTSEE